MSRVARPHGLDAPGNRGAAAVDVDRYRVLVAVIDYRAQVGTTNSVVADDVRDVFDYAFPEAHEVDHSLAVGTWRRCNID